ncbi:MAG: TolC family protein [Chryseobacterium sp.]|nr:MAG: TolC family protein [Chryseobacterium sp.]
MKKKIVVVMLLFMPFQMFAQQMWNLKGCIDYGLKNNRNSVIYENEKLAADAKAKELLADYLPKLGLSGSLDDNLKVQQSVIPAGVFSPEPTRIAFTQKYNTNLTAQLDQTIFDQSLLTGLKANKYSKQQADLNIEQSQETIIFNIGNAYYQIYVYREQLRLLRGNLDSYRKQMDAFRLQVDKGVTLKKDLDKVSVDYNNAMSQIRVAESNLTLSENQLKYEMGYPISDKLAIDSLSQQEAASPPPISSFKFNFSAANRVDYRLSEVDLKLLEIDEKRIRAGALPKLTAYARYGAVGFGQTLNPALTDLSGFSAIGLKLNFPIFDFFKRNAQVGQAKFKIDNQVQTLKLNQSKFQLEYENARTKLQNAQNSIEQEKRNIALAESVFQTTDLQFRKGITDLQDWISAQNAIKDAQNNYLNSLYNFYQARLELEKSGGTLKTFYTSL